MIVVQLNSVVTRVLLGIVGPGIWSTGRDHEELGKQLAATA